MTTITTDELKMFKESDVRIPIINVLDQEDFKKAHIPESKSIPFQSPKFVEKVRATAGSKDAAIVVYCAHERCDLAAKAAEKLEEHGFSKVYDYEDGIEGWKKAGMPVESSAYSN